MDIVGTILNCMEESPAVVKKKNEGTKNDYEDENQEYYWCAICGNIYTDEKNFINHKSTHKQNQKSESCAFTKQEKTVQNLSLPLKKENPSKSLDNPALNADIVQKPSYKCLVCGKMYTLWKKFNNHTRNHKRNEKKGKKYVANKNTKRLSSSATYVPPASPQIDVNLLSSPSENVIVNPTSHKPFLNYYQDMKSVDVDRVDHFSGESQSKSSLPEKEKKSVYECRICDRIFTVRKTYLNHKTNHNHNRNTGKLFFFKRGKNQQIPNENNGK